MINHLELADRFGFTPTLFTLDERRETGCESNTSRLCRLAFKYCIPPSTLYNHYFNDGKTAKSRQFFDFEVASQINSCTDHTVAFERKLNRMCGIDESKFFSYSYLNNIIDPKSHGLISKTKKWCSECYKERKIKYGNDDELGCFDDLYWSLDHVQHCMIHGQKLSTTCIYCGHTQPYISREVELGRCNHCRSFLGNNYESILDEDVLINFRTMFTMFYAHTFEEYQLDYRLFIANLQALKEAYGSETAPYLANSIGVDDTTVRAWIRGTKKPQIDNLFAIQRALSLFGPHQLFYPTAVFIRKVQVDPESSLKFNKRSRYGSIALDHEIKVHLNKIIDGELTPTNREDIAAHFEIDKNYLYRNHKILCDLASQAYNEYRQVQKEKLEGDLEFQLNKVVSEILSKGREPSLEVTIPKLPIQMIDEIKNTFTIDEMLIRVQKAVNAQIKKRRTKTRKII